MKKLSLFIVLCLSITFIYAQGQFPLVSVDDTVHLTSEDDNKLIYPAVDEFCIYPLKGIKPALNTDTDTVH